MGSALCPLPRTPRWEIAWASSFKPSFSVLALPVALGNIQAVALRDIFVQAQNRDSSPPSLQIEEPEWEKHRSVNLSELIDVYRYCPSMSLAVERPSGLIHHGVSEFGLTSE